MVTPEPVSHRQPAPLRPVWLVVLVALAALGCLWFLRRDAVGFLTWTRQSYTDYYWPRRHELLLHVSGGAFALGLGLLQVWLGLTGRTAGLHRWVGRLYLLAVACGAACAFYLVSQIPLDAYSLGLIGLGSAWVVTTVAGYRAIRRGDPVRHRAWMLRSYVVTFGFVTLRVTQNVLMGLGLADEDTSVAIAAWACWTVPLVLIEPLLRSPRRPRLVRGR